MKKSTRLKTLKLTTETIKTMTENALANVVGGLPTSRVQTEGKTCSCVNCNTGISDTCDRP